MPNRSIYQIPNVPDSYRHQLKGFAGKSGKNLAQAFMRVMDIFRLTQKDAILKQRLEQLTDEGLLDRWADGENQ